MQKFKAKSKSVPMDSSHVRCSTSPGLKKEEILSVSGSLKNDRLTLNIPEVNLPQHREGRTLSARVYVLSINGIALMPTTPRKAKILLKSNKAKGTHCKGARIMVNKKSISVKKVESVYHVGTLNWRMAFPPMAKAIGFPCHELL